MITLAMVEAGYKTPFPLIQLIPSPNADGVVCKIGDYWFYFGGEAAEGETPESYIANVPEDMIIREIHDVLEDFRRSPEYADEYAYYEAFLRDHGIAEMPLSATVSRREILFRGQTRRRGERVRMDGTPLPGNWVYGGVMPGNGDRSIIYGSISGENNDIYVATVDKYTVWADTVCEFSGCVDLNKNRIFEHDILRSKRNSELMVVKFQSGAFFATSVLDGTDVLLGKVCGECEVIGNEIDNSDLIIVPDNDLDCDGLAGFMLDTGLDAKSKKADEKNMSEEGERNG